ncbi:hypothetical protein [Burkholderia gladioli]|uniref:hypothetical protein n=1 Tax=Burkholderia gladioli TaxID=28095 RepID=UPI0018B0C688|nr:hypothetical protein [Burkholderia gladioli]
MAIEMLQHGLGEIEADLRRQQFGEVVHGPSGLVAGARRYFTAAPRRNRALASVLPSLARGRIADVRRHRATNQASAGKRRGSGVNVTRTFFVRRAAPRCVMRRDGRHGAMGRDRARRGAPTMLRRTR